MKTKFCLLTLISIFFIDVAYSQQLGWTFNEIIKLKGKNYEQTNNNDGYTLSYENYGKMIMDDGKKVSDLTEVYSFISTTNKVYKYISIGWKTESEIVEIIEKNNSKFKKVDMGSKQKGFQWIDTENNAEYNLSLFPEMNLGEYKSILYGCEIK